jgi:hypothetical protein
MAETHFPNSGGSSGSGVVRVGESGSYPVKATFRASLKSSFEISVSPTTATARAGTAEGVGTPEIGLSEPEQDATVRAAARRAKVPAILGPV